MLDIKAFISFYVFKFKSNDTKILPIITFEPTNICNAKCVFCGYRKINDIKYIMDFDTFKKGLNDFLDIGGKQIWLTPTVGEAFIDKNLFEKIKFAKEKNIIVKLYTNGTLLLKNENYKKIVDSGIDELYISIGDVDYKIESEMYGISEGVSKEKIEGIKKLLNYNNEILGIKKIYINFRPKRKDLDILNDEVYKNIFGFNYNFYLGIYFLYGYDNWGGLIKKSDLIGIMKLRRPLYFRKYPCIRLYNAISVLSNGDVRLCGCRILDTVFDELVVGNIHKSSLKEILFSEKVKNIREGFSKGIIPKVCKNCSFYEPNVLYKNSIDENMNYFN